jgi:hypothetical protein
MQIGGAETSWSSATSSLRDGGPTSAAPLHLASRAAESGLELPLPRTRNDVLGSSLMTAPAASVLARTTRRVDLRRPRRGDAAEG